MRKRRKYIRNLACFFGVVFGMIWMSVQTVHAEEVSETKGWEEVENRILEAFFFL